MFCFFWSILSVACYSLLLALYISEENREMSFCIVYSCYSYSIFICPLLSFVLPYFVELIRPIVLTLSMLFYINSDVFGVRMLRC